VVAAPSDARPSPAAAAAAVNALTPSASAPVRVQSPQPQPQVESSQPLAAKPLTAGTANTATTRPLTPDEQKMIQRARGQEGRAKKSDTKAQLRQDEINRNAAKVAQEREKKIAREKAKLER